MLIKHPSLSGIANDTSRDWQCSANDLGYVVRLTQSSLGFGGSYSNGGSTPVNSAFMKAMIFSPIAATAAGLASAISLLGSIYRSKDTFSSIVGGSLRITLGEIDDSTGLRRLDRHRRAMFLDRLCHQLQYCRRIQKASWGRKGHRRKCNLWRCRLAASGRCSACLEALGVREAS